MRSSLRPSRFLFALAALATPVLAAAPALAQFDAGTTANTFSSTDFFIGVQHQLGANLSDFDKARFFNKAHCDCNETVYVYFALTDSGFSKRLTVDRTGNIELWVGTDCGNTSLREARCLLLKGQTMDAYLNMGRDTVKTNARILSTYTGGGGQVNDAGAVINFTEETANPDCTLPLASFDQTLYVISNSNGSPVIIDQSSLFLDLTPPPQPTNIVVEGGNQAVTISWQAVDSALITDLLGYQVLCNRGGDLQVFSDGTFGPGYQECAMPRGDAGVGFGINDGGVNGLDPRFACSPLLKTTTTSFRTKILQNDITYGISVVAIDNSGNASAPDIFYGTPLKTKSFYDVYRNDDPDHPGTATGGLCTLGARTSSEGAAAGLGAALAIAAVVVARRRRRK